jgi:hypothetical protein
MLVLLRDLIGRVGFQGDQNPATSHIRETLDEMILYVEFVRNVDGCDEDFSE